MNHKKEYIEFCKKCEEPLCTECILKDHRDHSTYKIQNLEDEFRKLMLSSGEDDLLALEQHAQKRSTEITDSFHKCEADVPFIAAELRKEVTHREHKYLAHLKKAKEEELRQVKSVVKSYKKDKHDFEEKKKTIKKEWEDKGRMPSKERLMFQCKTLMNFRDDQVKLEASANLEFWMPSVKHYKLPNDIFEETQRGSRVKVNLVSNKRYLRGSVSSDDFESIILTKDDDSKDLPKSYQGTESQPESHEDTIRTPPAADLPVGVDENDSLRHTNNTIISGVQSQSPSDSKFPEEETHIKTPNTNMGSHENNRMDPEVVTPAYGTQKSKMSFESPNSQSDIKKLDAIPKNTQGNSPVAGSCRSTTPTAAPVLRYSLASHHTYRYFEGSYLTDLEGIERGLCTATLNGECRRIAYINDHIWAPIVDKNMIQIYSITGSKVNQISITSPVSLCQLGPWVFVACGREGIWKLQYNDSAQGASGLQKVVCGNYSDLSTCNERLYAWEYNTKKIQCYKVSDSNDGTLTLENQIPVEVTLKKKKETCKNDKLLVHQTRDGCLTFYLSEWAGHTVLELDKEGKVLQRYGSYASPDINFCHPFVCGIDQEKNVLISDQKSNLFKVINTRSGKFKSLASQFSSFAYDIMFFSNGDILTLGYSGTSVIHKGRFKMS